MGLNSALSGFYAKTVEERLALLQEQADLSPEEMGLLRAQGSLKGETANHMVENAIGCFELPLGVGMYFKVNGKDRLVPMAVEEPSVIAAASFAAKLCRETGGFTANSTDNIMIGQVQVLDVKDQKKAAHAIEKNKRLLLERANEEDPILVKLGGGAKDIECRKVVFGEGKKKKEMLIVHLLVDVRDAMGANVVNTFCETLTEPIEEITGGRVRLRILSNLAVKRITRAKAEWSRKALGESFKELKIKGEEVVQGILEAWEFAAADPYRAATHNKGIMNGMDAVAIATGNDFRALEAGAHSYAAFQGGYKPLTKYYKNKKGDLVGEIEVPLAVGIVGGATKTHPLAQVGLKLLGVKSAQELAETMASVGLAQNFAALRALAIEGIQRGHMKLHAHNIAKQAGARGKEIEQVAKKMAELKKVRVDLAKEILTAIRKR